jgi:Tfp pilus assembly protein PilO
LAENPIRAFFQGRRVRLLLIFLLVAAVLAEGYYIYLLQGKIEQRNDELKNISVQLQLFKTEREDLKANLSAAKKTGDAGNENTPAR